MMNGVILNGMDSEGGTDALIQDLLVSALRERNWHVEPLVFRDLDVKPCEGCFGCWLQSPGRCIAHDTDEIAAAVMQSDLAIYLTPVTFGGYSAQLKKVLDHLILFALPFFKTINGETHHVPRYKRRPNLLVIGTMPERDAESEAVFLDLAERNAINMSAPRWTAGVIVDGQATDAVRQSIHALLTQLEVM